MSPILLGLLAVGGVFALMQGQRTYKNIKRKRNTVNTYAIINAKTGKGIRVHNASIDDKAKINIFSHQNWECMTWQLIKLDGDRYLLKNLYTHKTFQPSSEPKAGVSLWQQPLEANSLQYWEFIEQAKDIFQIRLVGTELYATITGDKNHSDIVLMPLANSDEQRWKLIEQHPIA